MSNDPTVERIARMIGRGREFGPPSIEEVRPEVRTGATFPFREQMLGIDVEEPNDATRKLLGRILVEWGFDVRSGRQQSFHQWLVDNEADFIAAEDPIFYRGTYAVTMSTEKSAGIYRCLWSLSGPQDLVRLLAGPKPEIDTPFERLWAEYVGYIDRRARANFSYTLIQPAVGVDPLES